MLLFLVPFRSMFCFSSNRSTLFSYVELFSHCFCFIFAFFFLCCNVASSMVNDLTIPSRYYRITPAPSYCAACPKLKLKLPYCSAFFSFIVLIFEFFYTTYTYVTSIFPVFFFLTLFLPDVAPPLMLILQLATSYIQYYAQSTE